MAKNENSQNYLGGGVIGFAAEKMKEAGVFESLRPQKNASLSQKNFRRQRRRRSPLTVTKFLL